MNTKKIYITPGINVINILTTYIMAGSGPTPGGAKSGVGGDNSENVTITPGGSDGPVVQAKNNSFNAWETWEEYQ